MRHGVHVHLSRAQAKYVIEAIIEDLDGGDLTPEGVGRAEAALEKINHALSKTEKAAASCDATCACRQSPSALRKRSEAPA